MPRTQTIKHLSATIGPPVHLRVDDGVKNSACGKQIRLGRLTEHLPSVTCVQCLKSDVFDEAFEKLAAGT